MMTLEAYRLLSLAKWEAIMIDEIQIRSASQAAIIWNVESQTCITRYQCGYSDRIRRSVRSPMLTERERGPTWKTHGTAYRYS